MMAHQLINWSLAGDFILKNSTSYVPNVSLIFIIIVFLDFVMTLRTSDVFLNLANL